MAGFKQQNELFFWAFRNNLDVCVEGIVEKTRTSDKRSWAIMLIGCYVILSSEA